MSVTHAEFSIERNYECSPEQAFRGFSDPDLKRQWFANPANWPDAVWELDFRIGGAEVSGGGEPGGTRLLFTEQGAFFDGLDDPAQREHGTGWLLDRLGKVLAGEPVR
jgi:uncharacterized protein YndB with AHSA1/START domain